MSFPSPRARGEGKLSHYLGKPMTVQREEIIERLSHALVKAVELRIDLRAIDENMLYSTGPQESVDLALTSALNMQVRLITALTLV